MAVAGTGAVCPSFGDNVGSLVTGQMPVNRANSAARRSRWRGALLGDRVAAVHHQALPVMQDAPGLAGQAIAAAISPGEPLRPAGVACP
jgi:hypothetical protein